MKIPLSTIADRIGLQKRKIAALQKGRAEAYESVDAADSDKAKIQAKYTDGGDDGEAPQEISAEDKKSIEDFDSKIVAGRKAIAEAGKNISAAEVELNTLQQDYNERLSHNETEDRLTASSGSLITTGNIQSPAGAGGNVRFVPLTDKELDADIVCMFRGIVRAGSNTDRAPEIIRGMGNERVAAAMQANTFGSGGAFVPDVYLPRLIAGLFATAIVRSMGVAAIPIEGASVAMPRITSGAIAGYLGEGQDIDTTSVGTDRMSLVPKELGGLLPMSNTLLWQSSPGADQVFMQQLQIGMALAEDRSFLRGPKAGAGPTGLRYLAAASNIFVGTYVNAAKPTPTEIDFYLGQLELALENANTPMLRLYYVMAPRTFKYLQNLRDGNGNLIYETMSDPTPSIRGIPIKKSTNIPINISGDNSEIMLVDASQLLIGENPRINFAASTEASYKDSVTGETVSAFQRNETLMRMIMWNDINTQHPESIAILTGVRWGA